MKYLLTGATGYLGSQLLEALVAGAHQVIVLKRVNSNVARIAKWLDVVPCYEVDADGLEVCFERHAPFDAVIHAATCYGRSGENPVELVAANLVTPLRVLEYVVRGGAHLFVNVDTSLPRSLNEYSLSKKQFGEWGSRFANEGKLQWVNMILESFYGPGDDSSKLITWLVRSCINNVRELPLTWGEQRRDFIYIEDVVRAFQLVLSARTPEPSVEYCVGSGHGVQIRRVAEMVKSLSNSSTQLSYGSIPYRRHEVMESHADTRTIELLGWKPWISLEQGLRQTIDAEINHKSAEEVKCG